MPCAASLLVSIFRWMTFCQNVKRGTRESRICGRKAADGKYAILVHGSRDNLPAESGFCLTSARGRGISCAEGRGARQPPRRSAFFLLFHRRVSPRFRKKSNWKKQAKIPPFGKFFPGKGLKSGGMRTTASRFAEEKSVYCGKRRAPLRKANGNFAGFLSKICKQT